MYLRSLNGFLTNEFTAGVEQFVEFCQSMPYFERENPQIRCPCKRCGNRRILHPDVIRTHLYSRGFVPNYQQWVFQGETDAMYQVALEESIREEGSCSNDVPLHHTRQPDDGQMHQMVFDVAGPSMFANVDDASNFLEEDPNPEAQRLFDMLASASRPLYPGCEVSQLAAATTLLNIKAQFNMLERAYNLISDWYRWCGPAETTLPNNMYNMKKLVEGLGLPVQKIDCCKNGCMIFWGQDEGYLSCKFCGHPRYKIGKRKPVPHSRMFYLPITQRLQRLYASDATAAHMRWHEEHTQEEGVMRHPSDAEAWKHFNRRHLDFAAESRNEWLGLCTDGFNPFGASGQQYSS